MASRKRYWLDGQELRCFSPSYNHRAWMICVRVSTRDGGWKERAYAYVMGPRREAQMICRALNTEYDRQKGKKRCCGSSS